MDMEALRRSDVGLLDLLNISYICDLMVENRKKKYVHSYSV